MRVKVEETERYPSLRIEIEELSQGDPKAQRMPNVPPELITAWQKAERALARAEHAILLHLDLSRQWWEASEYGISFSPSKDVIKRWLADLDDEFGKPVSNHGEG